jgi:hypothetical protein
MWRRLKLWRGPILALPQGPRLPNLTLTPLPKHRLSSILRSIQSTTRRARKNDETRVSKIIQKIWRKVETLRPRFAECQNQMMEVPSKGIRLLELFSGLVFHRQLHLPMHIADVIRRLPSDYQFWVHGPIVAATDSPCLLEEPKPHDKCISEESHLHNHLYLELRCTQLEGVV